MIASEVVDNEIVKEEVVETRGGSTGSSVEHTELEEILSLMVRAHIPPLAELGIQNHNILWILFSMVVYMVDMGTDINLACHYYSQGEKLYFMLTILCVLIPGLIITMHSYIMYDKPEPEMPLCTRIIRISVILLLLGPVLGNWDLLNYIWKIRRAIKHQDLRAMEKWSALIESERKRIGVLRETECFMETAPQTVLQVSILLIDQENGSTLTLLYQLLSITASLVSITLSKVTVQHNTKFQNMSWSAWGMLFLGYFMMIASRIVSISLLASLFPVWTAVAFAVYGLVLYIYYMLLHTVVAPKECSTHVLAALQFGISDIFSGVLMSPDHERGTPYFCDIVHFMQNVIASIVWANGTESNVWYFLPLLICSLLFFIMGIIFRILYYLYLSPSPTYYIPIYVFFKVT